MTNRKFRIFGAMAASAVLTVAAVNYFSLQQTVSKVLHDDPRNDGLQVFVHYKYFINPSVLVYDLREVSGTSSPMDVMRVLLQFAAQQKDRSFEIVELSHKGKQKFRMKGEYFHLLGQDYGTQNPTYTIRTMPENLYRPDGASAFGTWTGGMLGVLGRQMEDVTSLHREWYIDDLSSDGAVKATHAN